MLTTIDHIALTASDLELATERYRALLGCEPTRDGDACARFQLNNVALVVMAQDDSGQADGIRSIGFATSELANARHRLERRGIGIEAATGQRLRLATSATQGVRIDIVERLSDVGSTPAASDMTASIFGLDHIVITTSHPERAAALYGARLGLEMKLDRANPDWGSRLMFFKCGDAIVEIAHSLKHAEPDAPDRLWGLSWRTDDIDAANARLSQSGFDVSDVRTGRKLGTRVFTVRDAPGNVPTLMIGK